MAEEDQVAFEGGFAPVAWSGGADDAAETQADLDREMARIQEEYEASGAVETQPRLDYAPYRSSVLRHPTKDLHHADPETIELHAPAFGQRDVHVLESDLTIQSGGEPIGERIKNRGVEDVLMLVCDGLKGLPAPWSPCGRPRSCRPAGST